MRGRDAGARCGGARNGPPGLQKRAVQESLRTAEKSRAGKPPDRKKGCAGKPPDRRRGRLTEAPAADRRGTRKDTPTAGSGRRPPRHSQRCPTAGCGGTEKGPKRSAIRFSNPEIPHHRKTGAIRRSGLPGYFRVTFGLHSVVIQPRGQRPTSAMPRPSTPPAAPSTPLFPFPHPSTPFNAGPFGPAALHPPGRTARTGGPPPPFRAAGARRLSPPCHPSTPPPLLPLPLPSPLRAASSLPRRDIFLPAAGEAPRFSVGGAVFRALIPTFAAQVRSVAAGSAGGGKSGQRRAPRKPIT